MRPGKPGFRIASVWAFIALDPEDNSEGVPAVLLKGSWCPLMAADEDRLKELRPIAQQMARASGVRMRLVRFDAMVELEDIEP